MRYILLLTALMALAFAAEGDTHIHIDDVEDPAMKKEASSQIGLLKEQAAQDKKKTESIERQKQQGTLPYDKWEDDMAYNRHRHGILTGNKWDGDAWHPFQQDSPDVKRMSTPKYTFYVVNREGEFVGNGTTWVFLFGLMPYDGVKQFGYEMQKAWNHTFNHGEEKFKFLLIEPEFDDMLDLAFWRRRTPSLFLVKDGMAYAYDKPGNLTEDSFTDWILDKQYLSSSYQFKAPAAVHRGTRDEAWHRFYGWMFRRVGWGFENALRNSQALKNVFSFVVDHDGTDIHKSKSDRLVVFVMVLMVLFGVFPMMWLGWKILFACCHVKKVVELSDKEWELYQKALKKNN